jgi:opacity protein-like surface antigen
MRILAALALTVFVTVTAAAQDPKRLEFTVYGGGTYAETREGNDGRGPAFGGMVEIRLFSRMGFAFDVQRSNHSGTITDPTFPWAHMDVDGHALDTSAGVVYHISNTHFEPFVDGGVGSIHTVRSQRDRSDEHTLFIRCFIPGCNFTPTFPASVGPWFKQDQRKTSFHGGVGVYIPLTSRILLRPAFRFVGTKDEHFFHAMVGISYRR